MTRTSSKRVIQISYKLVKNEVITALENENKDIKSIENELLKDEEKNGIEKHRLADEKHNQNVVLTPEEKIEATTAPVRSTESQLEGIADHQPQLNQDIDKLEQEKPQNEVKENVTTLETKGKNASSNTEVEVVSTEINEQSSGKLLQNKENEELIKAATIIQKVFRGYIVRNSDKKQNKNDQKLSAALIIQKYVRGYLVRRNMEKRITLGVVQVTSNQIKDDGNEATCSEENSNNEIVPPLPAYSNRFLIPKDSFLERESFADDEDYARTCKELAATSIQKTYRGYRVRRSLKASTENDPDTDDIRNEVENQIESFDNNDQVQTVVTEAERVISAVLDAATDVLPLGTEVLPLDTYDSDSFEDEGDENKIVDQKNSSQDQNGSSEPTVGHESVLGQIVQDNIHVEGQMQQKYNQIAFQGSPINPIEELSDSSEQPETPKLEPPQNTFKSSTQSESVDSKHDDVLKSFSYEQLSSDLSDTDENKRESLKESEVDETSRDELSEVENFDL